MERVICCADFSFVVDRTRSGIMAGWRQAVALAMTGEEIEALTALSRSRTEPAGRRVAGSDAARLSGEAYRSLRVGRRPGADHQTVQRCVERAMADGALAALDDRPRPGKSRRSRRRPRPGRYLWRCEQGQGARLIRMNCGRHGSWPAMRASADRAAGHQRLAPSAQGTSVELLGRRGNQACNVR